MKRKLLIIDDSIVTINTLYIMLRESYQIFVAKNGADGIRQAKEKGPSLILLDILMSGIDGFGVMEVLKQDRLTKEIPVMLISSLNEDKSEEKGMELGAIDYMSKPLKPSVLREKVKNYTDLYEYRRIRKNQEQLDGLTVIPNRLGFEEQMQTFWMEGKRKREPVTLSILDLDYFKEYNENYGHILGDQVLKQVAAVLKETMPTKKGALFRYGGEEFAVLLLGAEEKEAAAIIEEMRMAVQDLGIPHLYNGRENVVTISAGGVTLIPERQEIRDMIELTDKHLLFAKGLGRNQVVFQSTKKVQGQIDVSFFGTLTLSTKNGKLYLKQEKMQQIVALLVFLLLNRNYPYTKEDMIQALWPNGKVEEVDHKIRQLVEELQTKLLALKIGEGKDMIRMVNGRYLWNTNYQCNMDCELFMQLFAQAISEEKKEQQYILCEQAIRLYKDGFLTKIMYPAWIKEVSGQYQKRYEQLLEQLALLCLEQKEYKKIIQVCQRELYQEDFEEKLQFYYIKALLALGRKKEAQEHYEYMIDAYHLDGELELSKEFQDLYVEMWDLDEEKPINLEQVQAVMKENGIAAGGYYCNSYVFHNLYQLAARKQIKSGERQYMGVISIVDSKQFDKKKRMIYMHELYLIMKRIMRIEDVFSKLNNCQYALLYPCSAEDKAGVLLERIVNEFYKKQEEDRIQLSYHFKRVIPMETIQTKMQV